MPKSYYIKKERIKINKVILIGRITKDPELKYTPSNGTAVTTITVAVDNYNSKTKENNADFIPVVLWGKQAENTAQYLLKGSQVAISGRITNRSYDAKDGTKRYITEVVADAFGGIKFLSKGKGSNGDNTEKNPFNDEMAFIEEGEPVEMPW